MSEFDDSDILADIQALDEALALTAKTKSPCASSNQQSDVSSDVEDSENNDDYVDFLCANRDVDKSLNAYEINTKLIMGLTIAKKKLTILLEECKQKIKLLDEKITKSRDGASSKPKLTINDAGLPYFKDKDYFCAPKNHDAKLKEARGELFLPSLKRPNRWSGKDRETLLSAINNQAIESVLSGEFSKKIEESTSDNQAKKNKLILPRNFNEMVGPIGEKEFDWHKISVIDFDNKHSPIECRAMWNVYLHPNFRKNEWTNAEDDKLLKYAKEYKYQDWDAITRKLETNRSGYQCFIRFNTLKKATVGCRWTKQEDKHLLKIVNALRIGDQIPWAELANHMRHRTKQQIYVRWTYTKAPHLRKGRFTNSETSTLLKAVQKYGTNFSKISSVVMPHRTSVQLQLRYDTVIADKINLWTINDDVKLINLHVKYHNNWSKIATYFSGKSRIQVRHRYTALLKYIRKGVSLENIPRPPPSVPNRKMLINKKSSSNALKKSNKTILQEKKMQPTVCISDIQLRFYETLCFPPSDVSSKSSNSKEHYDIAQLARDTKKLYNILNLLNANLDISEDILNYVKVSDRERQLVLSLQQYINVLRNNEIPNSELIEKFRMQMFGHVPKVSENNSFIPPLPFDGYVRPKKIKKRSNTIDYNLEINDKFLVDMSAEFSIFLTPYILPFINVEEELQFYKLGQLLTKDYHDYGEQNIYLYKSLKCTLSFAKESASNEASSKYNELNANIKINLEDDEQLNMNTVSITENDKKTKINNVILPNEATLFGFKNLLLWKLLYDCQNESHQECESMASLKNERNLEQTTSSAQTKSAEYQLLRTRLLQLFKFPISLSNIVLQMSGPETIFQKKEKPIQTETEQNVTPIVVRKRHFQDTPMQLEDDLNVSADSNSQLNSDVTTRNIPAIRCKSCKRIHDKYKIITK